MAIGAQPALEAEVRALCEASDFADAASRALRGYGPEILGFLTATVGSTAEADDVFAEVSEKVWTGLPRFEWESSLRTWAYAIARNVSLSHRRNAGRRRRREAKVGESALASIVKEVRTETRSYLKSAVRTRVDELRDALPEEDRALLILRVDRELTWLEVARVLSGGGLQKEEVTREASRLRKRFQLLKERLRAEVENEGIVRSGKSAEETAGR